MAADATKPDASPFAQAMEQARQATEAFSSMFAAMTPTATPGVAAIIAAQQRNIEALSAANRIALENAQAIARRQTEIMQQTLAELGEAVRSLADPGAAPSTPAHQAERMQQAFGRAVANMQELSGLIQRASGEAAGVLNERLAAATEEARALMAKSTATKK